MRELPVAFIAYDLLESEGRDLRTEPQHVRRALLEALVDRLFAEAKARGERLPIRISPTVSADTWEELAEKREQARALTREGLMLKAREGAYGVGRRKGGDRTDVWWKWKLDPMSVDAVVIYAERGHGRRSGVYTDYTFAVWSAGEEAGPRELVPFAKAYSGLSDAEIREMDAIVRRTTVETFGPVRSVNADAGVRAWLRGHRAEQAPQERRRRPLSPHAALAARQAGRRGRHAGRAQGAAGGEGRLKGEAYEDAIGLNVIARRPKTDAAIQESSSAPRLLDRRVPPGSDPGGPRDDGDRAGATRLTPPRSRGPHICRRDNSPRSTRRGSAIDACRAGRSLSPTR